jgi:hypothetical protein
MKFHSRRRRSEVEIRELLERYHRSDSSQSTFARSEGICVATLARYLRSERASALATGPRFVEVEGVGAPQARSGCFVVRFGGVVSLEVPRGFCSAEAARLVSIIAALR